MSACDRAEMLRDYAFDELAAADRRSMEQHLIVCADCAAELDEVRLTTAALRVLPNCEIPQRIAFVSDKVFEPSLAGRLFGGFWNSAARLGFASACILGSALIVSAWLSASHRPAEVRTILQAADSSKQVSEAVAQAVALVRAEDARSTQATLEAEDRKHEREHRALIAAVQESLDLMQKRMSASTSLASLEAAPAGAGQ